MTKRKAAGEGCQFGPGKKRPLLSSARGRDLGYFPVGVFETMRMQSRSRRIQHPPRMQTVHLSRYPAGRLRFSGVQLVHRRPL